MIGLALHVAAFLFLAYVGFIGFIAIAGFIAMLLDSSNPKNEHVKEVHQEDAWALEWKRIKARPLSYFKFIFMVVFAVIGALGLLMVLFYRLQ